MCPYASRFTFYEVTLPQHIVVTVENHTTCSRTMVRLAKLAELCYNNLKRTSVLSKRKRAGDDRSDGGAVDTYTVLPAEGRLERFDSGPNTYWLRPRRFPMGPRLESLMALRVQFPGVI